MKKFLLLLSVLFISAKVSAFQLPMDRDGNPAQFVQDVGVRVYYSTGNVAPFLITGGTSAFASGLSGPMGVTGSSIAILGVLTSTPQGVTANNARFLPGFIEMRATNTANITSELLIPPISLGAWISTSNITLVGGVGGPSDADLPANNFIQFSPPIIAMDGLSVNITSNPTTSTSILWNYAIFYRYLATGAPEDVWVPIDDSQGIKTHDQDLYGVKASSQATAGGARNDTQGTESWDFNTGAKVVNYASSDTTNLTNSNSGIFYYGFSASSGAANSFFTCKSTGSTLGTTAANFLPSIYPRTINKTRFDSGDFVQFNFPWPLQVGNGGLQCQASVATERFRHYTRNRRTLR